MIWYIVKRLAIAIPTLLFIALVSFWLMHIAPGGPFDMERPMPEVVRANIEAKFHLDQPFLTQFWIYIGNFIQGDLGPSFVYQDFSVTQLVAQSWPVSAVLGVLSFCISVPLGMLLGTIAALNRNSRLDYGLMTLSMTGVVVPAFVLAPVLVMIFAIQLGWFPAGGWEGGKLAFLVLPVLSLAIGSIASIARVMRGAMIENAQPTIHSNGKSQRFVHNLHFIPSRFATIPDSRRCDARPCVCVCRDRLGNYRHFLWYRWHGTTLCVWGSQPRLRPSNGHYSDCRFTHYLL